ncbi:hypothetical protein ACFE04_006670 [Oxalis oulophora]
MDNGSTITTTVTTTQAYGESWYWDNRYAKESGPFDWYQKYHALAPLINLYVPPMHNKNNHNNNSTSSSTSPQILVVGCGNSEFSENMVDAGYDHVTNIDISSVVIEAMQNKISNRPHLKCILPILFIYREDMTMDVRDMSAFQSESFGAVIDKGTLDSILCGSNSRGNATKMLHEVWRVLKDKGVYILITYGAPIYRLRLLRELCSWDIKLHVIEKFLQEGGCSEKPLWELTKPVPLNEEESSVEAALGKAPDVHYIYVCIKVGEGRCVEAETCGISCRLSAEEDMAPFISPISYSFYSN